MNDGCCAVCVDDRAFDFDRRAAHASLVLSARLGYLDGMGKSILNQGQGLEIDDSPRQGWKKSMSATMSATSAGPHQNRVATFWQSTNGKKVVMAVTGAMMFLFVIGHLLGNLQVFEGPAKINGYSYLLHHGLAEVVWIVRIALILAIILHIIATVQLAMRNKKARPIGYSRKEAINSSYASRTMYWSGPIVLAFIIFHLLQFTAGVIHPEARFVEGDVYHNLVSGFQVWWVSAWYIFAITLLGFHLRHGIWSMFQSVGLAHPRHTQTLKHAALLIATLIVLGYISIPISILLGFVK